MLYYPHFLQMAWLSTAVKSLRLGGGGGGGGRCWAALDIRPSLRASFNLTAKTDTT